MMSHTVHRACLFSTLVVCCSLWSAHAWSQDRACLVETTLSSKDAATLLEALQIETRKAPSSWVWSRVKSRDACPETSPALSISWPYKATLHTPTRPSKRFDLDTMHPETLPRTLASYVVSALSFENDADAEIALFDPNALPSREPETTQAETTTQQPTTPPKYDTRWTLRAGGLYAAPWNVAQSFQGAFIETGPSWFGGTLALSATGSLFGSSARTNSGVSTDISGTELGIFARGGLRTGTFLWRAGIGVGAQFRTLTLASNGERTREVSDQNTIPLLAGDLEACWDINDRWHLAALLNVRAYLGTYETLWLGEGVYPANLGATGAQIALGASF